MSTTWQDTTAPVGRSPLKVVRDSHAGEDATGTSVPKGAPNADWKFPSYLWDSEYDARYIDPSKATQIATERRLKAERAYGLDSASATRLAGATETFASRDVEGGAGSSGTVVGTTGAQQKTKKYWKGALEGEGEGGAGGDAAAGSAAGAGETTQVISTRAAPSGANAKRWRTQYRENFEDIYAKGLGWTLK